MVDLDLPARPWLDLAYGTIEDGPITFEVTVTAAGTETSLLKRTVTTPQRWSTSRLELSEYAGQSVTLSLGLDADNPGMLGYWGSPVVRNSGAMPDNNDVTEDRSALLDGGSERPRAVVLFISDTMRRDHLEVYGYERSTAPTLTKLAGTCQRQWDTLRVAICVVREGMGGLDGLRERFGLRTPLTKRSMSGRCFAEHGFPAGNDLIGVPEVDLLGG